MERVKLLFVAANPLAAGRLAIDEELRSIEAKIAGSPGGSQFDIVALWAARPDDLIEALNQHRPTIMHFAGHASDEALHLAGADGQVQVVANDAILELLALASASSVRLVVLSACHSASLAERAAEIVGCSVGIAGQWLDDSAAPFSAALYRALGFGATIYEAVKQGCAAMMLEGVKGADSVRVHPEHGATDERLVQRPPNALDEPEPSLARSPGQALPVLDEYECVRFVDNLIKGAGYAYIFYIDVDGVLAINSVYGRTVGDLVLARCCEVVSSHAAGKAGACRLRGDQFIVVNTWPWAEGPMEDLRALIGAIRHQDWTALGENLHVTATGVFVSMQSGEDALDLILRAAMGMKSTKKFHIPVQEVGMSRDAGRDARPVRGQVVSERQYRFELLREKLS